MIRVADREKKINPPAPLRVISQPPAELRQLGIKSIYPRLYPNLRQSFANRLLRGGVVTNKIERSSVMACNFHYVVNITQKLRRGLGAALRGLGYSLGNKKPPGEGRLGEGEGCD